MVENGMIKPKEAVWRHSHVLTDLLEIIRTIEGLNFESSEHIMLAAADVIALHPSLQLDRGTKTLQ